VIVATTLALTAGWQGTAATAASPGFCGLTGFPAAPSYVWTGAAGDGSWQTAGNWTVGGVTATMPPGDPYDPNGPDDLDDSSRDVDYVCIGQEPGGTAADVTLGGGQYTAGPAVAALDIGQGADLTVDNNSKLWLNGPQTSSRTSYVRAGSELSIQGSTLGGIGTLSVSGTLETASLPSFPVTITTRWCDVGKHSPCSGPPPTKGKTNIAAGGLFTVDGNPSNAPAAGINLEDERIVDNSGTIRLANKGYIAADYGTSIKNDAGGTVDITNDFGIYEGRDHFGPPPVLTSSGVVQKSAGTGTSVIGTTYKQQTAGSLAVATGGLSVDRSTKKKGVTVPVATVTQGASYGLGACPAVVGGDPSACTESTVDAANPQSASVTLGSTSSSSTVQVATQTSGLPASHIGQAVQFETPGADPTTANPSLFVMVYDSSLVPAGGLSAFTMERAADNSNTFVAIPDCGSGGNPPSGQQSCVDMRGIAGVSSEILPNGDAKIVIRTTQNSRWVGV